MNNDLSREKYREKVAELDPRKSTAERELGALEDSAEYRKFLDSLPALVDEYIRDLPHLVHGRDAPVREYGTWGAGKTADNPLGSIP